MLLDFLNLNKKNKFIHSFRGNLAFTLIELLVVIAIIGILSGIILVTMSGATTSAQITKSKVFANSVRDVLGANLISEWRMDSGTIGNVATISNVLDSWGGNNAVAIGTTNGPIIRGGSDCVSGNCLQFDGTDDFVDVGGGTNLSMGTGDQTVSIWVKFNNATAANYETLFYCGGATDSAGSPGYWIHRYTGTSRLFSEFSDGTVTRVHTDYSNSSIGANQWYNIVVVFDRDSTIRAYQDGVLLSTTGDIHLKTASITNITNLKIGAFKQSASIYYVLNGYIDEPRIYSAALSTSQIQQLYLAGLNSLLANNGITEQEYNQRLAELYHYCAMK